MLFLGTFFFVFPLTSFPAFEGNGKVKNQGKTLNPRNYESLPSEKPDRFFEGCGGGWGGGTKPGRKVN